MKHKYLLSLALSIFIGVGVSLFVPPSNVSALNPINYTSHLIDDTVFTDSNSMGFASNQSNAQNIQAFLNSQGSGLAGFSAIETCASGIHYSYYASYYACGKNASAAQIIAAASQAYAINPRVILATLQKEQSLITNPNPAQSELDCAMGYLSCGGALGFFNQVDNAAWQFRTDMNLGSGISWWGYSPASYPCNNADTITHLYDNGLKAGNAVTFYNNANPNGYDTPYASFTLPNMSTASLYCYTPHVYNNPNGINGKPQYGSVGSYWSGTYNFVNAFINWWGTTYTSGFQASNVSQSAPATVIRGNSTFAFVKYQNAGSQPWYDDVSAPQYNTYGVHLATTNPINVGNQFSAFWPARNRAAMTFAHVYEADGVTLAANQHIAQPGQIVEFDFNFSVSSNTAPGTYENYFQPILDGSTLWNMGGVSRFNITVQQPTFQATFAGQSAFPTITQGASSAAYLKYQNSGNEPWYDNTTASIYNTYAVHLATTSPINSASPFSSSWPANNRPAINFAHVYEGDGVTLAANQHIAQPGQIVEFDFSFNANVAGGAYRQYFQPILEGSTLWNMGALSWLDVTVQPITFQATFAGQSAFPTITQGASSAAYLKYQNSGNEPWYDNTTASIYNTYAVHLATTSPINSASPFSSSWPANNRPAINFAHVYEGDGVTLAANQHIAQPGQIVEFDFSFNANVAGGAYRQYFQPILEGSTLWNMGALSWLDVTVQ